VNRLGFVYGRYLVCLHEKDLRDLLLGGMTELSEFPSSEEVGLTRILNDGAVSALVNVKHIGGVKGSGLFSRAYIDAGTCLGEYIGVLSSSCDHAERGYTLAYPSADGGYGINASDYGNLIRFINHSDHPNAQFKCVAHCGIVHVVCVSLPRIYYSTVLQQ
jgi:hypothetical protein